MLSIDVENMLDTLDIDDIREYVEENSPKSYSELEEDDFCDMSVEAHIESILDKKCLRIRTKEDIKKCLMDEVDMLYF